MKIRELWINTLFMGFLINTIKGNNIWFGPMGTGYSGNNRGNWPGSIIGGFRPYDAQIWNLAPSQIKTDEQANFHGPDKPQDDRFKTSFDVKSGFSNNQQTKNDGWGLNGVQAENHVTPKDESKDTPCDESHTDFSQINEETFEDTKKSDDIATQGIVVMTGWKPTQDGITLTTHEISNSQWDKLHEGGILTPGTTLWNHQNTDVWTPDENKEHAEERWQPGGNQQLTTEDWNAEINPHLTEDWRDERNKNDHEKWINEEKTGHTTEANDWMGKDSQKNVEDWNAEKKQQDSFNKEHHTPEQGWGPGGNLQTTGRSWSSTDEFQNERGWTKDNTLHKTNQDWRQEGNEKQFGYNEENRQLTEKPWTTNIPQIHQTNEDWRQERNEKQFGHNEENRQPTGKPWSLNTQQTDQTNEDWRQEGNEKQFGQNEENRQPTGKPWTTDTPRIYQTNGDWSQEGNEKQFGHNEENRQPTEKPRTTNTQEIHQTNEDWRQEGNDKQFGYNEENRQPTEKPWTKNTDSWTLTDNRQFKDTTLNPSMNQLSNDGASTFEGNMNSNDERWREEKNTFTGFIGTTPDHTWRMNNPNMGPSTFPIGEGKFVITDFATTSRDQRGNFIENNLHPASEGPHAQHQTQHGALDNTVTHIQDVNYDHTSGTEWPRGDSGNTESPFETRIPQGNYKGGDEYDYPDNSGTTSHENVIPGTAGVDYPNYSSLQETGFDCRKYEYPGYFADLETGCQMYHICQSDGRHDSFLCPVGTIFNQKLLTCDWWYNYDCLSSETYYSLNLMLYKETDAQGNFKGSHYVGGRGNVPQLQPHTVNTQTSVQTEKDSSGEIYEVKDERNDLPVMQSYYNLNEPVSTVGGGRTENNAVHNTFIEEDGQKYEAHSHNWRQDSSNEGSKNGDYINANVENGWNSESRNGEAMKNVHYTKETAGNVWSPESRKGEITENIDGWRGGNENTGIWKQDERGVHDNAHWNGEDYKLSNDGSWNMKIDREGAWNEAVKQHFEPQSKLTGESKINEQNTIFVQNDENSITRGEGSDSGKIHNWIEENEGVRVDRINNLMGSSFTDQKSVPVQRKSTERYEGSVLGLGASSDAGETSDNEEGSIFRLEERGVKAPGGSGKVEGRYGTSMEAGVRADGREDAKEFIFRAGDDAAEGNGRYDVSMGTKGIRGGGTGFEGRENTERIKEIYGIPTEEKLVGAGAEAPINEELVFRVGGSNVRGGIGRYGVSMEREATGERAEDSASREEVTATIGDVRYGVSIGATKGGTGVNTANVEGKYEELGIGMDPRKWVVSHEKVISRVPSGENSETTHRNSSLRYGDSWREVADGNGKENWREMFTSDEQQQSSEMKFVNVSLTPEVAKHKYQWYIRKQKDAQNESDKVSPQGEVLRRIQGARIIYKTISEDGSHGFKDGDWIMKDFKNLSNNSLRTNGSSIWEIHRNFSGQPIAINQKRRLAYDIKMPNKMNPTYRSISLAEIDNKKVKDVGQHNVSNIDFMQQIGNQTNSNKRYKVGFRAWSSNNTDLNRKDGESIVRRIDNDRITKIEGRKYKTARGRPRNMVTNSNIQNMPGRRIQQNNRIVPHYRMPVSTS